VPGGDSGTLVVRVVLLHVDGNLGLAHNSLGDLLGNSPVDGDGLVTVLDYGLLDSDCVGDLDGAWHLDLFVIVDDLGDGNLNLLDLVGANGHANNVGNHDGLGDHDSLVDVADGGNLDLLGDGLVNRAPGGDGAGNFDGLNVIHGVVNLLGSLAGNLDGLGVVDNLSLKSLNLLGAVRSVGLLDGVLLGLIGINSARDLLRDGNSAVMDVVIVLGKRVTVVMIVCDNGAVASRAVNRTVNLSH